MSAITLRKIPPEIHGYLLETQAKIKVDKKINQYSLEQVVYNIVKEHKDSAKKKTK